MIIYAYVCIKKSETGFVIIEVYVNDMNLIETLDELSKLLNI